MVVSVLEATVAQERERDLVEAYNAAADDPVPPGLMRSELLQDAREPRRWRIETHWSSREALDAMRAVGTPRGVLIFRAAGAEPALALFEVVARIAGE